MNQTTMTRFPIRSLARSLMRAAGGPAARLMVSAGLLCSLAAAPAIAQDAQRGAKLAEPCAACHGADGNSTAPSFPRIGGQHEDYLLHSLRSYRTGARKNAIMTAQIANLTEQDFRDLAAYYARMKGPLSVIRH
jgi:cytochrome c553